MIPWRIGPSWISCSDCPRTLCTSAPISALERLEVEVVGQLLVGELEHDLGEELVVLLPERHHEQQHELADARVDLADHAAVEEVDGAVRPEEVAGVRVGVEEPVDEHLPVVRLDQLARGVLALGRRRARRAAGTPSTKLSTRRRLLESSW